MTISNICGFYWTACNNRYNRLGFYVGDRRREPFCDIFRLDYINHRFSDMPYLYFSYERFYLERCRKDE